MDNFPIMAELQRVALFRRMFKHIKVLNPYDPLKEAVEDLFDNDYTYAEALVEYAHRQNLDIYDIAEMVNLMPDLLALVSREATDLHFI